MKSIFAAVILFLPMTAGAATLQLKKITCVTIQDPFPPDRIQTFVDGKIHGSEMKMNKGDVIDLSKTTPVSFNGGVTLTLKEIDPVSDDTLGSKAITDKPGTGTAQFRYFLGEYLVEYEVK